MRNETKGYILKEYGSWSVLTIAYLIGLLVSRGFKWEAVPVFIALALLINSKQAYMKWMRGTAARKPLAIFLGQIIAAAVILILAFKSDIPLLLPLLVFPAAYFVANRLAGEHFVLTEVLGFILISLAAVLAKFLITAGLDVRLFVAVGLYFAAGVFKVKILLLKRTRERIIMALYVLFSIFMYRGYHIPLIILLPFVDNLIVAAKPYKVKLQTTGWIEVAKSVLFLSLMTAYF
ncbi:MAG TPA: YwiC-like family protein [Nitrospirota bacterium]|nr:YwiC-like family protein [Nitrospirota bacterium]